VTTTIDPITVVIADDSLVAREMLVQILESDSSIKVVGQAKDGVEAVEMVKALRPDLVTMDIHMPKLDGLLATEQIMAYTPTPILVVSSSVHGEGMGRAFDALDLGALEVIKKPEPRDWADLDRIGRDVIRKVKILSRVRVITHMRGKASRISAGTYIDEAHRGARDLVAIGASTGGPSALLTVLGSLPADLPVPVLIAQHIAEGFVPGLVTWMDAGCKLSIRVAEDGMKVEPGVAYFAPTGANMVVSRNTVRFQPPSHGQLYIPSADTLFDSVARSHGKRAVGVILTGMGADGAAGLKLMRNAGAATIAQNEETCTVFGMPKEAIDIGAAERVLALSAIAEAITSLVVT
jgi:two-component system chemotaxis response regulator CheB